MSAPTQVLPSWLTLSTTVITAPDGSVTTSSTTLRLPLTYYGPSIPLGTDGSWTYGGLTSPVLTTSAAPPTTLVPSSITSATSIPPSITSSSTSSILSSSLSSMTSSSTSSSALSLSSSLSSRTSVPSSSAASSSAAAAVGSSHTLSTAHLGAILGAILGALMITVFLLIILLLRKNRGPRKRSEPGSNSSSSFWNRQTTLFSRRSRRQTPIWTEWQMVNADDTQDGGERSPGEGSPRGSGEEDDPFLTRSLRSGTNEMTQTKTGTDTLVSMPVAAAVAGGTSSTRRSGTKIGGPIIPRDELLARMNEDEGAPTPYVRLIEASPREHASPLLPPPLLGPDGRSLGRGTRPLDTKSTRSIASQPLSLASEKSLASLGEQEPAEFLTARRVKVPPLDVTENEAGPSAWSGPSGLERLANLPRLSWFRRMSYIGALTRDQDAEADAVANDPYTPTPRRSHSRQDSRTRPVSWAPLPTHDLSSADSMGRRPRPQSGLGLGLGVTGERPISSLSAKSRASAASGGTVYHDARSTPASSLVDVTSPAGTVGSAGSGVPPVPPIPRQASPNSADMPRMTTSGGFLSVPRNGDPPPYEEASSTSSTDQSPSIGVDVLDIPAPRPASPFSAASSRPDFPPGLVPLPTPRAWRDSQFTHGTVSSSGIQIDVLEEEPPSAQDGWRSLASGGGPGTGRRTTFGVPMVIHQRDARSSEQGSLHSMRSHLSPHSPLNASGSAPSSSLHTFHSSSSRPSMHSQGLTGSSSASISEEDRRTRRRGGVGEVAPPVSAVFSREGVWEGRSTSPVPHNPAMRPMTPIRQSPSSSMEEPTFPTPVTVSGTVTSSGTTRTEDTNTNSSVTTALTDPITGAVLHFPALPWRHAQDHSWTARDDDQMW